MEHLSQWLIGVCMAPVPPQGCWNGFVIPGQKVGHKTGTYAIYLSKRFSNRVEHAFLGTVL